MVESVPLLAWRLPVQGQAGLWNSSPCLRTDWQLFSCRADWLVVVAAEDHGFHRLAMPRQHLGWQGLFLPSHLSVMHPMRSYKRLYLKVLVRGGHRRCWHYQLTLGHSWRSRTQVLDLEIESLLDACCSSSSQRSLRPAIPPIAVFRAQVETVTYFWIEQGGKENCIPANTMWVTDSKRRKWYASSG
jgi:hypothetical protein